MNDKVKLLIGIVGGLGLCLLEVLLYALKVNELVGTFIMIGVIGILLVIDVIFYLKKKK